MKNLFKILISVILTLSMILHALPSFAITANADMYPLDNLTALGGSWRFNDVIESSGSGDNFALSNSRADNFIFESKVEFLERRGAASLVFFSPDTPNRGGYVANIDLSSGNARIFLFNPSGGATTKGEYKLTDAQRAKSTFHLRIEVYGNSMVYYLDGVPIISVVDTTAKYGDRLGLLTYNTSVNYSNVRWADISDEIPELTSLEGLSTYFMGQGVIKETIPYNTKNIKLTATVNNGVLAASADAASVEVNGQEITISDITENFNLEISVSNGNIFRNYIVQFEIETDPSLLYNELLRSQFHFSPKENWMNDPNGLVFDPSNNTWHLFYQYNPTSLSFTNQHWGHAVSSDLIHWKELGVAIYRDSLGAVFSGSAVVDENNTSGFFDDNKPGESKLVALFTCDGGDTTHGVEKQCIAYSKDHGVTWIRPSLKVDGFENPVISNKNDMYGRDFRDPKIFWYDDKWFMVIAGGRARLFTSENLIDWTPVCDMGFDSECPDLYPLPVDGDLNNIKWVYNASGRWYIIGRLEKKNDSEYQFVAESERITYNGGGEVYATQSFYNDGSGQNRRIAISWLQDFSAPSLENKLWNGFMSLPHEQTLRTVNGKIVLTSYPVAELQDLRGTKIADLSNTTVDAVSGILERNPGNAYDFAMSFKPEKNSILTYTLRSNGTNYTTVTYDSAANRLRVVRGRSSSVSASIPAGTMEMPLYPDKDGIVTIRVVMDTTVIEVFGNGGEAACTGLIFPGKDCINSSLEVSGNIEIKTFSMWRMTSGWHVDEEIIPDSGIYFVAPTMITVDNTIKVSAYYINENGECIEDGIVWGKVDATLASVVCQEGGILELKCIKEGELILTANIGNVNNSLTINITSKTFKSNLKDWTSTGEWYEDENGWSLLGCNDNSFTFSSAKNEGDFTYFGEANFNGRGGCLGLVFGATNPENPRSGTWYGANIDTHGANPVMKLFCNTNGHEVWKETYTFSSVTDIWKLKVTYRNGTLTYTVNGQSVSHKVENLPSGGLGLISWNGGGSFNNVRYTVTPNSVNFVKMIQALLKDLNELSFDYNADGVFNIVDLVRAKKYLAGLDVVLGIN